MEQLKVSVKLVYVNFHALALLEGTALILKLDSRVDVQN